MRYRIFTLSITVLSLGIVSCSNGHAPSKAGATNRDTSKPAPVETRSPNTSYLPAFSGQTRVAGVPTKTPYTVTELAAGLGRPWAVVPLPDGRLLITEKSGFMEIRDQSGRLIRKITGLPAVDARGQGGLLDAAPDPDFNTNRILYWSYSEPQPGGNLMAVAKGKLNESTGTMENVQVIFRAAPALNSSLHYGSRLVFDSAGYLFVSTGERSIPEGRKQAQWLNSGLGKIFRLTKDGKPAPGNPFIGREDALPEIYAYGIRNAQSLAIHPQTGELWEAEFGPRGGDELNLIKPGKNYGWPVITYGIEYSGKLIGEAIQQKDGMEQPVYYWDPVLSPSGMCFYEGKAIPEWENNLFIGGLSSQHICRLVLKNGKVTGEERLLSDQGERFRDVACVDGSLYTVTDGGKLFRISKEGK